MRPWSTGRPLAALAATAMAVALGLCARPAAAQTRTVPGARVVAFFDFEEAAKGNYEDLPAYWYVVGREASTSDTTFARQPLHAELTRLQSAYPRHTQVRFDPAQRAPGNHSFHFALDGGSAAAFLQKGAVPAVPGSDYRITAKVKTAGLRRAQARMTAYLVDGAGRRLEDSVRRSPGVQSEGRWREIGLTLPGDLETAAWVGLQLELVQDGEGDPLLGPRQVPYQDVKGQAWFDDVVIEQVPRVSLATQSPVNVLRAAERPTLSLSVRDLTGRAIVAETAVYDHHLQLVDRQSRSLPSGGQEKWDWSPRLPRFGWYLAHLTVTDQPDAAGPAGRRQGAVAVARSVGAFLWLGPEPRRHQERGRFLLDAQERPDAELRLLPDLLEQAGLSGAILSAWDRQTSKANIEQRQDKLGRMVQGMARRGQQVMLSLNPVPSELSETLRVEAHDTLALFAREEDFWDPYLASILMRQGQRIHGWGVGTPRHPVAFRQADLPRVLASVIEDFQRMAPSPRLMVPWRIDQAPRTDVPPATVYDLDVPPTVQAEQLGEHLRPWRDPQPLPFMLHLRQPPATERTHQRRVEDLALRLVHGWNAGAEALALTAPWAEAGQRQPALTPDPLLGAFARLAQHLAGRRLAARLNLGDGLECFVYGDAAGSDRHGLMVAYNRYARPQDAAACLYLGAAPRAFDLWGNSIELPVVEGRHELTLTSEPLLIEGVDVELARFRAAFALTPSFIESTQEPQKARVQLLNPWKRTISGTMQFISPKAWRIAPQRYEFHLPAGGSLEIPLEIMVPVSEVAGHAQVTARFDFTAEQRYVVDLSAPVELGLRDVRFDASAGLEPRGDGAPADLVVTVLVANTGTQNAALYVSAHLPGQPRQERLIAQLQPGQSAVRRMRFVAAGDLARQAPVRVSLRDSSGPKMLNKTLTVGPPR